MSRHFEIRAVVALPGDDDEAEEGFLAILHDNIRELGHLVEERVQVSISDPRQI